MAKIFGVSNSNGLPFVYTVSHTCDPLGATHPDDALLVSFLLHKIDHLSTKHLGVSDIHGRTPISRRYSPQIAVQAAAFGEWCYRMGTQDPTMGAYILPIRGRTDRSTMRSLNIHYDMKFGREAFVTLWQEPELKSIQQHIKPPAATVAAGKAYVGSQIDI